MLTYSTNSTKGSTISTKGARIKKKSNENVTEKVILKIVLQEVSSSSKIGENEQKRTRSCMDKENEYENPPDGD
jgi:hypothetical protein